MAKTKNKEADNLNNVSAKIKDLKIELIKAKSNASKNGNSKIKKAKKEIARILTLNKSHREELK